MNVEKLQKAIALAAKVGRVWVATADAEGMPHIAAAAKLESDDQETIEVTEWFCPGTVANLRANKQISVVVWDQASDSGYQLFGRVQRSADVGVLNGYAVGLEGRPPLPQVQRKLLIAVEKVIDFRLGPHSDTED